MGNSWWHMDRGGQGGSLLPAPVMVAPCHFLIRHLFYTDLRESHATAEILRQIPSQSVAVWGEALASLRAFQWGASTKWFGGASLPEVIGIWSQAKGQQRIQLKTAIYPKCIRLGKWVSVGNLCNLSLWFLSTHFPPEIPLSVSFPLFRNLGSVFNGRSRKGDSAEFYIWLIWLCTCSEAYNVFLILWCIT